MFEILVEELDAEKAVGGGAGELVREGVAGIGAAEGHGRDGGLVFMHCRMSVVNIEKGVHEDGDIGGE